MTAITQVFGALGVVWAACAILPFLLGFWIGRATARPRAPVVRRRRHAFR